MDQSAGSRSESDDISVRGAGEPPAAKKVKQCGPTSANWNLLTLMVHSILLVLSFWTCGCGNTIYISSLLALTVTNGLCVLYAKREVKPFGFLAVMGLLSTRMKKHLIDVHNMYVGGFMHLMHAFMAHSCMPNDGCARAAKQTDSKGVASAQGRGILSGFVTKHFVPRLTDEEHKHAYALMVKAHSAAILPQSSQVPTRCLDGSQVPGYSSFQCALWESILTAKTDRGTKKMAHGWRKGGKSRCNKNFNI